MNPRSSWQAENFGRYFLLLILTGLLILFFMMIKVFLMPILLAGVFSTLLYPIFKRVAAKLGNRRSLASFLCCVMMLILIFVPIYILTVLVAQEGVRFYSDAQGKIKQILSQGNDGLLASIQNSSWFRMLHLETVDWQKTLQDSAKTAGGVVALIIRKTSGGALSVLANIFITLFIIFYFFRDGESFLKRLRELIPLRDEYQDAFYTRFATVSRATIKGMLVIGLTQSTIGAITLYIFGVQSAVLWFVVMLIVSMIPIVGAWIVMHPAALIQILLGNVWQGVGIFLVTVLVISNIDNFLRPRLVGQLSGLHDLLIFFSALGGIQLFGAMGVLIGPILAAFVVTILDIYSREFSEQLAVSQQSATPPITPP